MLPPQRAKSHFQGDLSQSGDAQGLSPKVINFAHLHKYSYFEDALWIGETWFASWYVQNVSTFLNPFAIVSPLICVFWIQLTRTNAVFSRIALVSRFSAEIQLLGKILEKYRKVSILPEDTQSQNTRRRGATRGSHHLVARARPGRAKGWCGHPSHRLDPFFLLHIPSDLKTSGVWRFF
jgi:hypothetical protein